MASFTPRPDPERRQLTRKEQEWGKRSFDNSLLRRGYAFLSQDIWTPELTALPRLRASFYKLCRVLFLTVRGFLHDRCLFRASALTYVTILAMVPTLALAASVAKGFGAWNHLTEKVIDPFLAEYLGEDAATALEAEAGPAAASQSDWTGNLREVVDQVLAFVEKTDFASLGAVGLVILIFAAIKLLGSVESSFNEIWGARRSRNLVRKITDYVSMVIVTPLFLILATGITSAAQYRQALESVGALGEQVGMGWLVGPILKSTSLVVIWLGFSFVYLALPNTRTKVTSALLGGIVAGTIWQLAWVLHARFQVGVANYNAIYSTFAALPILMVWVHVSWGVVLFGAELAAAHQSEPVYRHLARARPMDPRLAEVTALRATARVVQAFSHGAPAPTGLDLAGEVGVPPRAMEQVLDLLVEGRVLSETESGGAFAFLPAVDPARLTVKQVLDATLGVGVEPESDEGPLDRRVRRHLAGLETALAESAHNRSLKDLVAAAEKDALEASQDPAHEATPDPVPEG